MGCSRKFKLLLVLLVVVAQALSLPFGQQDRNVIPYVYPVVLEEKIVNPEEVLEKPLTATEVSYVPIEVIGKKVYTPPLEIPQSPAEKVIYQPLQVIEVPLEIPQSPVEELIYQTTEDIEEKYQTLPVKIPQPPVEEVIYKPPQVILVPVEIPQPPVEEIIYEPQQVIEEKYEVFPGEIAEIPVDDTVPLYVIPETKEAVPYVLPEIVVSEPINAGSPEGTQQLTMLEVVNASPDVVYGPGPTIAEGSVAGERLNVNQFTVERPYYPFMEFKPSSFEEVRSFTQMLPLPYENPFSALPVDHKGIFDNFREATGNGRLPHNFFPSFEQSNFPVPRKYVYSSVTRRNTNPVESFAFEPQGPRHFPTYESEFADLTNGDGEYLKDVNLIEKALEVTKVLNKVKGAFTPILQQMVEDSSGSNVVDICKLSKARLSISIASDAFSANFVHFLKSDSKDFDKKCRFESFRAVRVLEDALNGITRDVYAFPELVQELLESVSLIQGVIQSLTIKESSRILEARYVTPDV